MCTVLKSGVYLYTLILLGYQASQRWRALLLRGPGQGRKLAQPSAGKAPLGLAGYSLELAKHCHAELSSRDSGPVTLSCFPPTSSVALSLKSPGLPQPLCFSLPWPITGTSKFSQLPFPRFKKKFCVSLGAAA